MDYRLIFSQHSLLFLQPSLPTVFFSVCFPFSLQSKKDKPIIRLDDPVMSVEYCVEPEF